MKTVKCVVDGEEVERRVEYIEQPGDMPGSPVLPRAIPFLKPGEEIFWMAFDDRPHIVKTGNAT